jgi:hypothetical protein
VPRTDVVFASIHRFTDRRAPSRDGNGFAVNYADKARALELYVFPVREGQVQFGLKGGVYEAGQFAPYLLVYKKTSSPSLPIPFLATTYIPDMQGSVDNQNLIGIINAGHVGSFLLKRSAETPYKFQLQCREKIHQYISCRMIARPSLPSQPSIEGEPSYKFDYFKSNTDDKDAFLMIIFFRALCFHMTQNAVSGGTSEVSKFILYRHDKPTPEQMLVTSGLVFHEGDTWNNFELVIPDHLLHQWVHSLPWPNNINERKVYGGQQAQSVGPGPSSASKRKK